MQLYWEEILVLMSPTSSLSTSVNSRHGFSTMKIKLTFLSKNLLEMVTLFKILCIVTQKVKSSSLRETCKFLKYNEWIHSVVLVTYLSLLCMKSLLL